MLSAIILSVSRQMLLISNIYLVISFDIFLRSYIRFFISSDVIIFLPIDADNARIDVIL